MSTAAQSVRRFRQPASAALRAVLLVLTLCGSARSQSLAPLVAPSQWMSQLAEHELAPGYDELKRRVDALATAVEALCRVPGDAARAGAAQAWRAAALQLRRLSALPFGPVLDTRVLRQLDFWPTRPAQIEAAIAGQAAGTLPPDRVGASARGLPALEYLLFAAKRVPIDVDPAACAYAGWVAREALSRLRALPPAWPAWQQTLETPDAEHEARLLSDAVNTLIGSVDSLRVKYLEKPSHSQARPAAFDAWRSGSSRAHLLAYLDGLRVGLQSSGSSEPAPAGSGAPGLTALMRGRGMLELAARMDEKLAAAAAAMVALPADPASDPAALAHAIDAVASLQALLSRELAERLKVWVGFGESDGD